MEIPRDALIELLAGVIGGAVVIALGAMLAAAICWAIRTSIYGRPDDQ